MNRTWVAMLAAVALLAQSASMAWASTRDAVSGEPVAAEPAMPCHGDEPDAGGTPDCCNGDCIFMSGGAPLPTPLATPVAPDSDHAFPAAPVPAPLASHTLSPFRPPAA